MLCVTPAFAAIRTCHVTSHRCACNISRSVANTPRKHSPITICIRALQCTSTWMHEHQAPESTVDQPCGSLSAGNIRRIFGEIFEMLCAEWYTSRTSFHNIRRTTFPPSTLPQQAPESTLVYHSAHGILNIPPNIRRILPADRLPHGLPTVDSGAYPAHFHKGHTN